MLERSESDLSEEKMSADNDADEKLENDSTSTNQKMKNTALRISRSDMIGVEVIAERLGLTPSKIVHLVVKGILSGAFR